MQSTSTLSNYILFDAGMSIGALKMQEYSYYNLRVMAIPADPLPNRHNLNPKRFFFKYACLLIQRRPKGITFAFI